MIIQPSTGVNHGLVSIFKYELDPDKQMQAREKILKKIKSGRGGNRAAEGVGFVGVTNAKLLEQSRA